MQTQSASAATARLRVETIAEGVWLHTSYRVLPDLGPFPSNGLIVRATKGVVVIDTAWTMEQTVELLDHCETHLGPVLAVVVTHSHADRTAGLPEVHRRGIPSIGLAATARLSAHQKTEGPRELFDPHLSLERFGVAGEVVFPGVGHSPDNVVVWLAAPRVLFGGCLIKSLDSVTLGQVADSDPGAWPDTIAERRRRYPAPALVVPGHGAPGDTYLLDHPLALLTAG